MRWGNITTISERARRIQRFHFYFTPPTKMGEVLDDILLRSPSLCSNMAQQKPFLLDGFLFATPITLWWLAFRNRFPGCLWWTIVLSVWLEMGAEGSWSVIEGVRESFDANLAELFKKLCRVDFFSRSHSVVLCSGFACDCLDWYRKKN